MAGRIPSAWTTPLRPPAPMASHDIRGWIPSYPPYMRRLSSCEPSPHEQFNFSKAAYGRAVTQDTVESDGRHSQAGLSRRSNGKQGGGPCKQFKQERELH